MATETAEKLSTCGHVEVLADVGLVSVEGLINFTTGESTTACVLREIKIGKSGKMDVGKKWIQMLHCPICGEKLLAEQVGAKQS